MAIDPTLLTLLQELVTAWDPTIDVTEGSDFYAAVESPFLERIGASPLDVDLETFFVDRLRTEIEDIDVSEFSGLRDLLIRGELPLFLPFRREIRAVKITNSINNYDEMTRAELDDLLANYFTSLREGDVAQVQVRIYYSVPQSVIVTPGNKFSTPAGVAFFPTVVQTISSEQMSFQQSAGLYYFDVTVESEGTGEAYNVAAEEINLVQGLPGVLRVANLADVNDSIAEETKEDAVTRAQESLTLRTLTNSRGIAFLLRENFSFIDTLTTIKYGDPEMLRDFIEGPVTGIGGIPGGPFGTSVLDIDENGVHVGGLVDVYLYQEEPDQTQVDIDKVTDKGSRIHVGTRGYTPSGGGATFLDDAGNFVARNVNPNGLSGSTSWTTDWLLLGEDEYIISAVLDDTLTLLDSDGVTPAALTGSLTAQTYEIVRRDPSWLTIPLYDLVAAAGGFPLLSTGGVPLTPVPGSEDLDPLLDGTGATIEKTENISTSNINLPLLRVSSVEELDPLTLDATGNTISLGEAVAVKVLSGFSEDSEATGKVRFYFKEPVNVFLLPNSWTAVNSVYLNTCTKLVAASGRTYNQVTVPMAIPAGVTVSGTAAATQVQIECGSSGVAITTAAALQAGDRLLIEDTTNSVNFYVQVVTATDSGTEAIVDIRETLVDSFASMNIFFGEGTTKSAMTSQGVDESGLYYYDNRYDFEVDSAVGAVPDPEDYFASWTLETAEGYRVRTSYSNLSYSVREKPYLTISNWVRDSTWVGDSAADFAYRVNTDYADSLVAAQQFVNDDDNEVPSQDLLIRHYRPAYVFSPDMVVRGISEADALSTIEDFIKAKDPEEELQASDLVDAIYEAGGTKVQSPYTLVGIAQSEERTWTATISTDTLGTIRVQHFLPDSDAFSITEEAGS